jgi:two-component sensor histidine kinase
MPFVVLTRRTGDLSRNPAALRLMELLGNVSFLERPFHPTTFVSMLQVALRARGRQLQTREHLDRQLLLTAELDHRVKNMLAVIQALVLRTTAGAQSLDDFASNLGGRINAMSQTHSLLSESHWEGAGLGAIIESELAAYRSEDGANVEIRGPEVLLRPRAAAAVSMAIHELATNAAKYGAFSANDGRVLVEWTLAHGEEQLTMRWAESGGPPVREPRRRGFGTSVIERALVYELNGSATLEFQPGGVVCQLAIPTGQLARGGGATARPASSIEAPPWSSRVRRVLVVEDSAFVAMDVVEAVSGLGWRVVGPVNRLPDALNLAQSEPLDGAVLDINLDGDFVYPVAEVLQGRGVPFVFASGYVGRSIVPSRFHDAPLVEKPFKTEGLQAAMRQTFAR